MTASHSFRPPPDSRPPSALILPGSRPLVPSTFYFFRVLSLIQRKEIYFLKVPLRRKIVDPILNASEQHFHTSLNGVFSFSISCFVLEISRFFETSKLGISDVIYSRIINYIYQTVNISVNSTQKFFKLCMTIAI